MEVTIGMTDNSKEQVRYRRAQNLLIIVGKGMLMLALWNGIKTAGILILRKNQAMATLKSIPEIKEADLSDPMLYKIFIAIVVAYMAVIIGARLFVGVCAIRTGMGKRHLLYIPLTITLITYSMSEFEDAFRYTVDGLNSSAGAIEQFTYTPAPVIMVIEFTSMIMMIELLVAAIVVLWYRFKNRNSNKPEEPQAKAIDMELTQESGITGD